MWSPLYAHIARLAPKPRQLSLHPHVLRKGCTQTPRIELQTTNWTVINLACSAAAAVYTALQQQRYYVLSEQELASVYRCYLEWGKVQRDGRREGGGKQSEENIKNGNGHTIKINSCKRYILDSLGSFILILDLMINLRSNTALPKINLNYQKFWTTLISEDI
jgi:hypothetical protein